MLAALALTNVLLVFALWFIVLKKQDAR